MQLTQNTDNVMENEVKRRIDLAIDDFRLCVIVEVRKCRKSGYPKVLEHFRYSKENEYEYEILNRDNIVQSTAHYDVIANRALNKMLQEISYLKFSDCMYIHNNILNPKT